MAKLPAINATLIRVQAHDDTPRWTGSAPANVLDRHVIEPSDMSLDLFHVTTVAVPSSVPVEIRDVLTLTRNGAEMTCLVESTEDRSDYGFTRILTRSRQ